MMIARLLRTLLSLAKGNKLPNETIKIDGAPYLTRYYLTGENTRVVGEGRNLFIHHFHSSDQGRELHNHPYTGTSLILRGGYREERMSVVDHEPSLTPTAYPYHGTVAMQPVYGPVFTKVFRPGSINFLGLHDFHRTELLDETNGAWTLFLTGPRVQSWGFLDRLSQVFYPYMSKRDERLGSGPHSRGVHKAPSVTSRARVAPHDALPVRDQLGTREERDAADALRRSQAAYDAEHYVSFGTPYGTFVNAGKLDHLRPNDRHGLVQVDDESPTARFYRSSPSVAAMLEQIRADAIKARAERGGK